MLQLSNIEVRTIKTMVDGSISIQLVTQEMTPEQMTEIFMMKQAGFSEEGLQIDQREGKSPSERLRAVLFLLFKYKDEGYTDFNLYYAHKMEEMITFVKNKLPSKE